ncbi:asparagine synthase (glutamine-hydrolyzing) [candidate division KSB1 bacterium]|nr:asparagine synthase (glutamine-hydrolyzing) [candidate division KSB1 bacterium]
MIWGIIYKDQKGNVPKESFKKMGYFGDGVVGEMKIHQGKNFAVGSIPLPHVNSEQAAPAANDDETVIVVFQGQIYNAAELLDSETLAACRGNQSQIALLLYQKRGKDFIKDVNGKFAFAVIDKNENKVILGRDRFGIEPLYYSFDNNKLIFSSTLQSIVNNPDVKKEVNFHALYQFLLFNYNPALYTFYKNVNKLRPAHLLVYNERITNIEPYWKLSFAEITPQKEKEIAEELLQRMTEAVRLRVDNSLQNGIFLSGGMDSSTMVALTSSFIENELKTFSFRCRGETFDESHYAQIVADHYKTIHKLTEYSAEDVDSIAELVKHMNEPFCDVGINIATYILGKAAENEVNCVITGDGGDELYGGHPVYMADKAAKYFDLIPSVLTKPFLSLGSMLPDSDKKKNLVVKAKRFSESFQYPKELFSHRWRVYYQPKQINELIDKDLIEQMNSYDPYQVILRFNKEADGRDILSRSLYSDYNTVVSFYLRRMGLMRHFGIDPRFPMLDHTLVEYAAKIPSKLKIKGSSDTKYIFKKAMENVLPHDIVYRKDKLGHSIPLKNWMRDDAKVNEFITDWLSESVIKKRGFFDYKYVSKMLDDHLAKKMNNSHRLWALVVLELWFKENI